MADGKQIYEWFQSGQLDPLEFAQTEIKGLLEEFHRDADGLRVANNDMQANWEGDAAESAGKGIGPLIEGHLQSLGLIEDTANSTQSQADVYAQSKNSVVPVPDAPEKPSMWARGASAILPGVPDPMESYRDGMNAHNDANANNVRVMDQYGAGTGQNRGQLPSDFGIMEDDGAALTIGTTSASAVGTPTSGAPTFGSPGGLSGGSSSGVGGFGPGPNVNAPGPIGGGPAPGGLPSPTPGGAPPALVPGPGGNPPVRPGPGMPIVGPIGGGPPGSSENERRAGRTTTGRPAAGSSRAGARMTGGAAPGAGKPTSILRGGPGAGAQARLTGGTAGLQAGKGAGAMPGRGPGGAAAAKAAAGGLGGRAGAGGMGAAGAGGARGKGEEDGEHKDKYAIKEELDDGLQVEYDELGAKTIDDKTGNTVVSPVIGEPDYVAGADEKPKD